MFYVYISRHLGENMRNFKLKNISIFVYTITFKLITGLFFRLFKIP